MRAIVALTGLALVGSGWAQTIDPSLMPKPSRSRGTLSDSLADWNASLAGRLDNQKGWRLSAVGWVAGMPLWDAYGGQATLVSVLSQGDPSMPDDEVYDQLSAMDCTGFLNPLYNLSRDDERAFALRITSTHEPWLPFDVSLGFGWNF